MIYIVGSSGKLGQIIEASFKLDYDIKVSHKSHSSEIYVDLTSGSENLSKKLKFGDVVLFLAGMSDPQTCSERYLELPNLVDNTVRFIEKFGNFAQVYFFSSDVVVKLQDNCNVANSDVSEHISNAYAWSKFQVEQRIRFISNVKVLRLSNVITENDPILHDLQECLAADKQFKIFHPYYRNITHVDDLIDCIRFLISINPIQISSIINISGLDNISRLYLFGSLCKRLDINHEVVLRSGENRIILERNHMLPLPKLSPLEWLLHRF